MKLKLFLNLIFVFTVSSCSSTEVKKNRENSQPLSQSQGEPVKNDHLLKNPVQETPEKLVEEDVKMISTCLDPKNQKEFQESDSGYDRCRRDNADQGTDQNIKTKFYRSKKIKKGNLTFSTKEEI